MITAAYRLLFKVVPDPCLVVHQQTGRVVDANPALLRLAGLGRQKVVGSVLQDLEFFQDSVRLSAKAPGQVVSILTPAGVQRVSVDIRRVNHAASDTVLVLLAPMEREEAAARPKFGAPAREIIDCAPFGVLELDASFQVCRANPSIARTLGCSQKELAGTPVTRYFDQADWARVADDAGRPDFVETELRRQDGQLSRVHCRAVAVGAGSGQAPLVLFVFDKAGWGPNFVQEERQRLLDAAFNDLSGILKDLEEEGVSPVAQPHPDLTEREVMLLRQIRLGLTNQAIAIETNRSLASVKASLSKLYKKVGVPGRLELVVWLSNKDIF